MRVMNATSLASLGVSTFAPGLDQTVRMAEEADRAGLWRVASSML